MTMLDLLAMEHNRLQAHRVKEGRPKHKSQFSEEMVALCSLLDKIQVFPARFLEGYKELENELEMVK